MEKAKGKVTGKAEAPSGMLGGSALGYNVEQPRATGPVVKKRAGSETSPQPQTGGLCASEGHLFIEGCTHPSRPLRFSGLNVADATSPLHLYAPSFALMGLTQLYDLDQEHVRADPPI